MVLYILLNYKIIIDRINLKLKNLEILYKIHFNYKFQIFILIIVKIIRKIRKIIFTPNLYERNFLDFKCLVCNIT